MLVACLQPDTRFKPLGEQLSKHLVSSHAPHGADRPDVWGTVCWLLHGGAAVSVILTGMSVMSVTYWQL